MDVTVQSEMYNVCRIYKKAQKIQNLPEIVFHKVYIFLLTQQLSKLSELLRESGDIVIDGVFTNVCC